MSQSETDDDRADPNRGTEWPEADLFDLADSIRAEEPIEEIAMLLCRSPREVREKIAELEYSGELTRLIEETAANRPAAMRTPSYESELVMFRELWSALRLIRATVEELAPSDAVANDERPGSGPMREADAIIRGIHAIATGGRAVKGVG